MYVVWLGSKPFRCQPSSTGPATLHAPMTLASQNSFVLGAWTWHSITWWTCWSQTWKLVTCTVMQSDELETHTADRTSWGGLCSSSRRLPLSTDVYVHYKTSVLNARPCSNQHRGFMCHVCSVSVRQELASSLIDVRLTYRLWSEDPSCRQLSPP